MQKLKVNVSNNSQQNSTNDFQIVEDNVHSALRLMENAPYGCLVAPQDLNTDYESSGTYFDAEGQNITLVNHTSGVRWTLCCGQACLHEMRKRNLYPILFAEKQEHLVNCLFREIYEPNDDDVESIQVHRWSFSNAGVFCTVPKCKGCDRQQIYKALPTAEITILPQVDSNVIRNQSNLIVQSNPCSCPLTSSRTLVSERSKIMWPYHLPSTLAHPGLNLIACNGTTQGNSG